jgi:hypothetical protein
MKTEFTREELVELLNNAIVPVEKWRDRDTSAAQRQLGECYALVKAGCGFNVYRGNGHVHTRSVHTLEIVVSFPGFDSFEYGAGNNDIKTYYAPSPERLETSKGRDWY